MKKDFNNYTVYSHLTWSFMGIDMVLHVLVFLGSVRYRILPWLWNEPRGISLAHYSPSITEKEQMTKPISVLAFKSVLRGWTVHLNVINKKTSFVKTRERCSKNLSDEIKYNVPDWHEQLPKTPAVYNNYTLALERMHLGAVYQKNHLCSQKVHKPGWTIHSQTEQNDLFTKWIEICSQIWKNHLFTFHFQDNFFQQIRLDHSFMDQTEQIILIWLYQLAEW